MKKFLALFTCAENSKNHEKWKKLSTLEQKDRTSRGFEAQEKWNQKYKGQIISESGDLGKVISVNKSGGQSIPSKMGKFMVVQAESLDEAASMFLDHPHFAIFPGDGVEIIEYLNS